MLAVFGKKEKKKKEKFRKKNFFHGARSQFFARSVPGVAINYISCIFG